MPDRTPSDEDSDSTPVSFDARERLPDSFLDNPIWGALSTEHLGLALGDGRARRYPAEIGPLSGIPAQTEENYAALSELAGDGVVVLFSVEPIVPMGRLRVIRSGPIVQMVRKTRGVEPDAGELAPHRLTTEDAPAMVALAELTEPGPFRLRTLELGNFYGIFHGERLVAMAGKRMHLPGMVEVSGVCTHPDARGKGYARRLMQILIEEIEREGRTAFLHAFSTNPAIRLYEALGFELRREFYFAALVNAG
jgi:ribosomal protein S18 acetylase RimI-like enzyme